MVRTGILSESENQDVKEFFAIASEQNISAEPVNWLGNISPDIWNIDGGTGQFDWHEEEEIFPDVVTVYP